MHCDKKKVGTTEERKKARFLRGGLELEWKGDDGFRSSSVAMSAKLCHKSQSIGGRGCVIPQPGRQWPRMRVHGISNVHTTGFALDLDRLGFTFLHSFHLFSTPEIAGGDLVEEGDDAVLDLEDLHLEDDGGVGRHGALDALLAVALGRGNGDAPDLAGARSLHAVVPAGDARLHERVEKLVLSPDPNRNHNKRFCAQ